MTDLAGPSLTFAIADLHGRSDLLEDAITAVHDYPAGAYGRTLILLGDYVDRGPHGAQVIVPQRVGAGSALRAITKP